MFGPYVVKAYNVAFLGVRVTFVPKRAVCPHTVKRLVFIAMKRIGKVSQWYSWGQISKFGASKRPYEGFRALKEGRICTRTYVNRGERLHLPALNQIHLHSTLRLMRPIWQPTLLH